MDSVADYGRAGDENTSGYTMSAPRSPVDDSPGPRPELRAALETTLTADVGSFRETVDRLGTEHGFGTEQLTTTPDTFDPKGGVTGMSVRDRELVWRAWTLEAAPIGVVLTGPAYQDNPVVYANRATCRLTGYSLSELRGGNLRRLQGARTDPDPVGTLREAIRGWSSVTVELCNYRADGTPFVNRVSIVPVSDADGTVQHWFGLQAAVPDEESASGVRVPCSRD